MLIAQAFAQEGAPAAGGADILTSLLPLLLIGVVFYFLLIRPQQKKAKEHRQMIENLRRGDRVVTSGGIVGTVTKVGDDGQVQLEIAEGVRVKVVRATISTVMDKGQPVASGGGGRGGRNRRKQREEEPEEAVEDTADETKSDEQSGSQR